MKALQAITISIVLLFSTVCLATQATDQQHELQNRIQALQQMESGQQQSNLVTTEDATISLQDFLAYQQANRPNTDGNSRAATSDWYFSTNPADLQPLVDTKWYFEYIILITFNKTVTFADAVEYTSDGYVILYCTDEYGYPGGVMFTYNIPYNPYVSGNAFTLLVYGSTLDHFMTFQINGNSANGFYMFQSHSDGSYSNVYSLAGTMLSGPAPTPQPDPQPDPTPTPTPTPTPFSWNYMQGTLDHMALGDFNGDGRDDVAGLTSTYLFYSLDLATWNYIPMNFTSLTAGDIDGDGIDELVGTTATGQIFYSSDLYSWTQIDGILNKIFSGDLDGDGVDELIGLTSGGLIFYTN